MKTKSRLKIAVQKNGRLNNDSLDLLTQCGIKIRRYSNSLLCHCENLPVDILFVRDDDIPILVMNDVCDLGIVGENVLFEYGEEDSLQVIKKLGFGRCRLSMAWDSEKDFNGINALQNMRIATSYPNILKKFLKENDLTAKIVAISGSVEIAPKLGMADAICDLVSTGRTLEENNLKELIQVIESQAVLIKRQSDLDSEKNEIFQLLLRRIGGVLKAQGSKYIMFHAPKDALPNIKKILPGHESPTIMPLEGLADKVAVHLVSSEGVFWTTLENLKQMGASSILVLPIEKMLS